MRVIAMSALRDFWNAPGTKDPERPLRQWYSIAARAMNHERALQLVQEVAESIGVALGTSMRVVELD